MFVTTNCSYVRYFILLKNGNVTLLNETDALALSQDLPALYGVTFV